MKIWPIAMLGVACLIVFSGCRTDPAIQLLERDNRRLEDEIYRLRACLEDSNSSMTVDSEVAGAKRPTRRLRDETLDSGLLKNHGLPPGATDTPPTVEMNPAPENEVPGIRPRSGDGPTRAKPNSAPGASNIPKRSRPMPNVEPAGPILGEAAEGESSAPGVPAENISYVPPPKGDSFNAVQIVLHDRLCTASDTGGLRVAFEAHDRRDRRVDAPAAVSVVLIDPRLNLPEARVARWDFPADAVASMFRRIGNTTAIYIDAPWPDKPPEQKKLQLFVRYTTRDGRKLQVDRWIEVVREADRTTRAKPPERLRPIVEEPAAPIVAAEEPAARPAEEPPVESAALPAENRREPVRTAARENSSRLQRPVWSPDRR